MNMFSRKGHLKFDTEYRLIAHVPKVACNWSGSRVVKFTESALSLLPQGEKKD